MKSVTIEQVIAWQPCGYDDDDDGENYTPQRIEMLFDGRESLTARDIAALDIPKRDVIWALLHKEFVTERQMHILACDFAESIVHLCGDDPRPRAAIDAKRAWMRGDISDAELAAAWAAARAAASAAARAAASVAARAASSATDWATARAQQIELILEAIQ